MPSASPTNLSPTALAFLAERHLATLTTLRSDGSPHVVAVGFTWDATTGIARVITRDLSHKARNAARGGRAAVCQFDRGRWITLEGTTRVATDAAAVADGEARYAERYQTPRPNPQRVVIEITVDKVLGSAGVLDWSAG
ncbi:MAG: PPOX class F420-dependent oxidoreductase [Mycobacteriaceae bacterium]